MTRSLHKLLTAMSLTMLIATSLLWADSFFRERAFRREWSDHDYDLFLRWGSIEFQYNRFPRPKPWREGSYTVTCEDYFFWTTSHKPDFEWLTLGFKYGYFGYTPVRGGPYFVLRIPYWPIVLISVVLPRRWLIWQLRKRRGQCVNCGYDVRVQAGSGATDAKCPECGMNLR